MTEFISLALRPDVVRRALLYAVVVGGILILKQVGLKVICRLCRMK